MGEWFDPTAHARAGTHRDCPFFRSYGHSQNHQSGVGYHDNAGYRPTLPPMPQIDILSLSGVLIMLQQLLIGFAMGFTMRLVFSAIELAGQISGMTMGLGFASFYDPQSQGQSVATSQFFPSSPCCFFSTSMGI